MDYFIVIIMVLFVISISYVILFQIKEGRDERGKFILTRAYTSAYFILVIGLCLALLLLNWSNSVLLVSVKDIVMMLLSLSGISAAVIILFLRKRH